MSGPSLSQPPNPLSFLWERQLKQEHSRLQQRMNEQDAILATVHKRILEAEKASGMSNAASRDVRQLRDDLESYMNDPEEKEKDQRIVNILRDHEEEIRGLETKTNNWRSSFESCQDEVSKLEDTYGQRIKEIELKLEKRTTARESDINTEISKRTSDRLGALEAQNNRLSELVPQLNKLQTTLNSIKSISEGQAVEIVRLKQALDEAQKKIEAEQSSGNRTKQPQQPQVLVPRSPVLTDNYPASTTISPAPIYRTSEPILVDRHYRQEAQIPQLNERISSETQGTTQNEEQNEPHSEPEDDLDLDQSLPPPKRSLPQGYRQTGLAKRQKLSQNAEVEKIRQMIPPNKGSSKAKSTIRKPDKIAANISNYQATQLLQPATTRGRDPVPASTQKRPLEQVAPTQSRITRRAARKPTFKELDFNLKERIVPEKTHSTQLNPQSSVLPKALQSSKPFRSMPKKPAVVKSVPTPPLPSKAPGPKSAMQPAPKPRQRQRRKPPTIEDCIDTSMAHK